MKKFFIKTFLGGLLLISGITDSWSQQRAQLFPGARPFGLGETFVAIADDGNAIYWNPAGLPYLNREEFNLMYSDLYGIGIKNFYLSYTRPIIKKFAVGIDWLNYGFADDELSFGRNYWNLSVGYSLNSHLAFGGNFKYVKTNTQLKGTSIWDANANGWGMDLGVLFNYRFNDLKFLKELRSGFMLHDVTGTYIRFDSGKREKILSRNPRFGFCFKPFDHVTYKGLSLYDPIIAMDFDDRFHLGSEVWFLKNVLPLALRGGIQKDFNGDESWIWSGGFSIQKNMFRIDYSYTMPPTLPSTHRVSFAIIYNFNPHKVEVSKPQIEPVFSSLIKRYNNLEKSIGKTTIKNNHDKPLEETKVTFTQKDYIQTPIISWEGNLDTGAVTTVDLLANFNNSIIYNEETENSLTGKVEVSYKFNKKRYTESVPIRFHLFGNQAILWKVPGRAAAFITGRDSLVTAFSTTVRQFYQDDSSSWFLRREIADAIKIFESLRAYDVGPTPDPNAAYTAATKDGFYIDTIQWPDALLSKKPELRKGDCEDLAILYASLLESTQIQTALLKTTGHIFMMFNTGIPIAHRHSLPLDDHLFVPTKGYFWIPVETTLIESSFTKAWRSGVNNFRTASQKNDLDTLFVYNEKKEFPPLDHAPIKRTRWNLPEPSTVSQLTENSLNEIEQWKSGFIERYKEELRNQPKNHDARNQLACFYAGLSQMTQVKAEFDNILEYDSLHAAALNNRGNINFIKGDLKNARRDYENCLKSQKFKTGLYLNLAVLYQVMSNEKQFAKEEQILQEKSYQMLERLTSLFSKDSTKVLAILGIQQEELQYYLTADEKKGKTWKERKEEVKKFINKAFAWILKKRDSRAKEKPCLKPAGPTGSEEDEDRCFILYWDFEGE